MPAAPIASENDAAPMPDSATVAPPPLREVEHPVPSSPPSDRPEGLREIKRRLKWRLRGWPERFCLITGAPRSGTTALYGWLDQNKQVRAATESRILVAATALVEQATRFKRLRWRREELIIRSRDLVAVHYGGRRILPNREVVIDKEPLEPIAFPDRRYGAFLKNMRILFPGVRFLFMVRDPLATVWSMRQRKWGYSLVDQEPRAFSLEEHVQNWCECADLAIQYAEDPHSYACSFERLVSDSEAESRRIEKFLGVAPADPFETNPVKKVGFGEEERAYILQTTRPQVQALQEKGIWEPATGD